MKAIQRSRARRLKQVAGDLDITAFMNLMVILVPFLLITAAFSPITVLDIAVPPPLAPASATSSLNEQALRIDVTIRQDGIEVSDNKIGLIKKIKNVNGRYDTNALSELLQNMKDRVPDKRDANVLVEPDIAYDVVVQVMDSVKVAEIKNNGTRVKMELFPAISLGDAAAK